MACYGRGCQRYIVCSANMQGAQEIQHTACLCGNRYGCIYRYIIINKIQALTLALWPAIS